MLIEQIPNNNNKGNALHTRTSLHKNTQGFSPIIGIIAVVLIAGLAIGGWYVWNKQQNPSRSPNQSNSQGNDKESTEKDDTDKVADPAEGWKTFNNSTYGIGLKYPTDWKIDEAAIDPNASGTSVAYAINVKRSEEVKYNNTVAIEVLNTELSDVETAQDQIYAQVPSNPAIKTSLKVSGKEAIEYSFGETPPKLYLIDLGNKTIIFRSINEELNMSKDTAYWTKFDNILQSLELN